MSIRAYARSRGVSHVAVLKASKAGRIPLEPDGTIDPAKADAAWDQSTDPSKARGTTKPAPKPAKPPPETMKPVAEAAVGSVRETLKEQGLPASGSVTFVQARTAHEIAKAHLARLRLQRMKGELVDRSRAIATVFALARRERDGWVQWQPRSPPSSPSNCRSIRTRASRFSNPMSTPFRKSSPKSAPTLDDGFDGLAEIARAWRQGLVPIPR